MVVKLKTRMSGPGGQNPPGSIINVDEKQAKALIDGGYAESLETEPAEKVEPKKTKKK